MAGGRNKEEQLLLQVKPEYREKNAPVRFEASIANKAGLLPVGRKDVSQK